MIKSQAVDTLVAYHTASKTLEQLINLHPDYRPTVRCINNRSVKDKVELKMIADLYDEAQAERGDPRRAYRS